MLEDGPEGEHGHKGDRWVLMCGDHRVPFPADPFRPPELEAVARGSDALTLLENAVTRNQFIDELMEVSSSSAGAAQAQVGFLAAPFPPPTASFSPQLELFLAQRLVEMEEEADVLAASQFQLAPAVLQGQTSTRVGTLLASTRALLDQLSTRRMQHLFIILASPRSPHWENLGNWRAGEGRLGGSWR